MMLHPVHAQVRLGSRLGRQGASGAMLRRSMPAAAPIAMLPRPMLRQKWLDCTAGPGQHSGASPERVMAGKRVKRGAGEYSVQPGDRADAAEWLAARLTVAGACRPVNATVEALRCRH